ncbi:MAG: hypothetical protein KF688_04795 [Pirellulales bacterium]|nr:hypothetical protein [Pirellulales bacterium]
MRKLFAPLPAVALVVALLGLTPLVSRAAVLGQGDVLPDPLGDLLDVVDGGSLAELIVGGTGQFIDGTDAGVLTIDAPTFTDPLEVTGDATIGGEEFSLGQVIIGGLNSQLSVDGVLRVGEGGQGFLEISTGARVISNFSSNPGQITSPDLIMGELEGAQGFILIDGFASSLVSDNMWIGNEGSGYIGLANRARMGTSETARLGVEDIGEGYVLVQGLGSRWNVGDGPNFPGDPALANLDIGYAGRGGVEMLEQGVIRVENNATLGVLTNSYGEAYVSGQGSQFWVLNNLTVGVAGAGVLRVADRGLARVDGVMTVNAVSFVNMAGGTVRVDSGLGTIANAGVIRGDGRIEGSIANGIGGELRAASLPGYVREKLLVTGDVTGGVIEAFGGEIEIQGALTSPTEIRINNGIVRVGGVFTAGAAVDFTLSSDPAAIFAASTSLSGDLTVNFGSGFNPSATETFTLISGGPVSGTFASENLPTGWNVYYLPTSVVLQNAALPPIFAAADFNEDGFVDGTDLSLWQAGYGTGSGAAHGDGDANTDGAVNGTDFLTWQRQFGSGAPAAPLVAAVPEPATLTLAVLAGLGLAARRRAK